VAHDARTGGIPAPGTTTVVIMGVTGTGKTTVMRALAKRLQWPSAEGDEFHSAANIEKMRGGHPLTDEDRWPWLEAIGAWIGERERAGESALVACSALRRAYRDLLRRGHASVWFVHLIAPKEVLEDRMEHRPAHYMPVSLLASQLETLEPLGADEPGIVVSTRSPVEELVEEIIRRLPPVVRGSVDSHAP
jgi:gluconokinase